MSLKEIKDFEKAVKDDPNMLEEVKNLGSDLEAIVDYANQKGFSFTIDEVKKAQENSGELKDEDLDQVSGGATTNPWGGVSVVVSVVVGY